ncbi:PQQ-binding-like beta-propeller repeat protein [Planctomycetales bacterium ZRK34]|nr:PQQ-binding-like beta-propeller repeat protein [Planctomycetales bacterium ZRK34]
MRTRLGPCLLIAAMLTLCAAAMAQAQHDGGADWPRFGGPQGDFTSPEVGVDLNWPEAGPPLKWKIELGEGYCAPAIEHGRMFVFDRVEGNVRLRCLKPDTGQVNWQFVYPSDFVDQYGYDGGPRAMPIVDEDRVYTFGPEGMLHCLSAIDGSVLWKVDTAKQFGVVQNFFGVGAAPVIFKDKLIVQVGGSPPDSPPTISGRVKGNGSGIVAFDKRTGKVVYSITDELASYAAPTLAEVDGRAWCFVLARGGLVGFNPETGQVDFEFPWRSRKTESVNAASPVVVDDHVLISETYELGACLLKVKPGGYDVVWSDADKRTRHKSMMAHWATPIVITGYAYGCTGRNSGGAEVRCIELATGKVMWSQPGLGRTRLLGVHGKLIVLGEYGQLISIRATPEKFDVIAQAAPTDADGERLIEYPAWASPVLSHGLMYVRSKGRLVCFDLKGQP